MTRHDVYTLALKQRRESLPRMLLAIILIGQNRVEHVTLDLLLRHACEGIAGRRAGWPRHSEPPLAGVQYEPAAVGQHRELVHTKGDAAGARRRLMLRDEVTPCTQAAHLANHAQSLIAVLRRCGACESRYRHLSILYGWLLAREVQLLVGLVRFAAVVLEGCSLVHRRDCCTPPVEAPGSHQRHPEGARPALLLRPLCVGRSVPALSPPLVYTLAVRLLLPAGLRHDRTLLPVLDRSGNRAEDRFPPRPTGRCAFDRCTPERGLLCLPEGGSPAGGCLHRSRVVHKRDLDGCRDRRSTTWRGWPMTTFVTRRTVWTPSTRALSASTTSPGGVSR